jgi:hypothetical protein
MKVVRAGDSQGEGVELPSVKRQHRGEWTPERRRLVRDRAMLWLHVHAKLSLRELVEIGKAFKDDPIGSTPGILKRITASREVCEAEVEALRLRNAQRASLDPDIWD